MTILGQADPRLEPLRELLAANVDSGVERGVSLCVVHDGKVVADLWGGWADEERTVPWTEDTITPVWSTSKTMVNLAALVLHDRGVLDVDAPVARYWPEFAQAGKADVTVAMLLSHSSGVSGWAQPVSVDDLYDWERSTSMLAAQEPWWEPGTASGYHLLNQGHLVGEVIRRATGSDVGEFVAKEIAGPLGADVHLGLDPAHDARFSPVTPPVPIDIDLDGVEPEGIMVRTLTGPFLHAREANSERWRRGLVPAANGVANARGVARVQQLVSHGGEANGVRLLSPATIERLLEPQTDGNDLVLDVPVRFGLGWAVDGRRCWWGGLGGSYVVNDVERRLTIAYVMNRMIFEHAPGPGPRRIRPVGDSRSDAYVATVYEALA